MSHGSGEEAVRELLDAFTERRNAHDGKACARPFAVHADFTNIVGLRAHGRDMIARGHDEVFWTCLRNARISSTLQSIRFIRPDVAVADVAFSLQSESGGRLG